MFKYVGSWLIYMVLLQVSSEGRITSIKAHFHGVHQHNMYFTLNSYYLSYNKQIEKQKHRLKLTTKSQNPSSFLLQLLISSSWNFICNKGGSYRE